MRRPVLAIILLCCVALLVGGLASHEWLVSSYKGSYGAVHLGLFQVKTPRGSVASWSEMTVPAWVTVPRGLACIGGIALAVALVIAAIRLWRGGRVDLATIWIAMGTFVVFVAWVWAATVQWQSWEELELGASAHCGLAATLIALVVLYMGRYAHRAPIAVQRYSCQRCTTALVWADPYRRWWCGGCQQFF